MLGPLLALVLVARAEVVRFAVLVGNNEGGTATRPLYFAETDAKKMHGILTEIGGVEPAGARMLLGRGRNDLLLAMAAVRAPIEQAKARGAQTVLTFYYSGHADEKQLQLGRTWVTWAELEELLDRSGADVRLAFVDACRSGALTTRTKGGTRAPSFVFDVSKSLTTTGSLILTSSGDDEASQESDAIGGSYFTHFLASAMTGAADDDGDGRVTLSETYRYVYHETVYRTATTRGGAQHPHHAWELSGSGDIPLTELDRAGGTLVFPSTVPGTYAIFDRDRRLFVAEITVDGVERRISLRAGRYLVQRRFPTHLAVAELSLQGIRTVAAGDFRAWEYEDDVAKGAIDETIRRSDAPRWSATGVVGSRAFVGAVASEQYFPNTAAVGVDTRATWRSGAWIGLDALAAAGTGTIAVPGLPYTIPTEVQSAALGVSAGIATPDFPLRAGIGARLEATTITRAFPDSGVPDQALATIAPGAAAWVNVNSGGFQVEASLRAHYLPYVVDGEDRGMGFTEAMLGLGWRF